MLESRATTRAVVEETLEVLARHRTGLKYVFKSSFDKANRTSISSYRGPGIEEGLTILDEIRSEYNIMVTSDIHLPRHARVASNVIDIVQIPAHMCRQTDLIIAASEMFNTVNVKKGQFMSPEATRFIVEKASSSGANSVLLTERGTTYGSDDLVVDYRSFHTLNKFAPVIYDATHSIQQPPNGTQTTKGDIEYLPSLARAAVATGYLSGLFIETHPAPRLARCDRHSMWPLDRLEGLLISLCELWDVVDAQRKRNAVSERRKSVIPTHRVSHSE